MMRFALERLENIMGQRRKAFFSVIFFFLKLDGSHYDRIHSSLTTVRCLDNDYVGKQSVGWKEYCAEY